MGKFATSWSLMKASWEILKKDKQMLVFPVISGIALIILFTSFIGPLILAGNSNWLREFASNNEEIVNLLFIFLFYYITYFVIIFFNAAVIACATIRMNGGDPTVADGLRAAMARLPQIAGWSLISATVGMVLRIIEERLELVGRIVAGLLGMAWSVTSFLVVPILVIEKKYPFSSFNESAKLLKRTWGEQVIGNFSFGLIFFALSLPGWLLISLGVFTAEGIVTIGFISVGILYIILLVIIQSTLQGIFQAAFYQFARWSKVPAGFRGKLLKSAIVSK